MAEQEAIDFQRKHGKWVFVYLASIVVALCGLAWLLYIPADVRMAREEAQVTQREREFKEWQRERAIRQWKEEEEKKRQRRREIREVIDEYRR